MLLNRESGDASVLKTSSICAGYSLNKRFLSFPIFVREEGGMEVPARKIAVGMTASIVIPPIRHAVRGPCKLCHGKRKPTIN